MIILEQFITIITFLLAIYASITIILLLLTILKHRDELYKAKYEDYIEQKSRVLEEIKKGKQNAE